MRICDQEFIYFVKFRAAEMWLTRERCCCLYCDRRAQALFVSGEKRSRVSNACFVHITIEKLPNMHYVMCSYHRTLFLSVCLKSLNCRISLWDLKLVIKERVNWLVDLMFAPCVIRRSGNNQHYAQLCTTALFCILAPTCFSSSLPSSGSFWICLSYMKIQIDLVVCLKYITVKN
jgi:hypothetical protein